VAHPKHEQVRARYSRRCAYCGIGEADAGGELTVDHYRPVAAGGDDGDDNLVYACFRCNLYKGVFFPNSSELALGRRILHPLLDDAHKHLQVNLQTGEVESLTETGRFHVALLRLNRPELIQFRLRRRLAALQVERLQLLENENLHLRATCARQDEYLALLRRLLDIQTRGSEESPA
jgi:hypothetical protein